jgi:lysophospholipase L1-like esterase
VIPHLLSLLTHIPPHIKAAVFGFPFAEKASSRLKQRLPPQVSFIDFPLLDQELELLHEDGTHLNEKGLEEMKKRIHQFLETEISKAQ